MIHGVEALSLRKKRKKNPVIAAIFKTILIMFLIYIVFVQFLATPVSLGSESMNPGMEGGDRIIASPLVYGPVIPFSTLRFMGFQKPERGDIVIVTPPYYHKGNFFNRISEPIVRFFSFQKKTFIHDADEKRLSEFSVKRIIGLPGDTIKMERFITYIKPHDSIVFIHEQKIIQQVYSFYVDSDYFPDNWQSTFPFSGNTGEITLKSDEYFVLGDNRTGSNDSYSWGPLPFSRVVGKIIFQYWPLSRFGIR